jgi:hypothetical protein
MLLLPAKCAYFGYKVLDDLRGDVKRVVIQGIVQGVATPL